VQFRTAPLESQLLVRLQQNLSEAVSRAGGAYFRSEELSMKKSILVSLAILTLSTSGALAAQRTHHSRAMNPNASTAAMNPNRAMNANAFAGTGASPVGWQGGVSSSDRAQYMKNLHDSGYNPKNDFNANGTIKTQ
jgi:hypothetical protein